MKAHTDASQSKIMNKITFLSVKLEEIFVLVSYSSRTLRSMRVDGLGIIFMHQPMITTTPAPGTLTFCLLKPCKIPTLREQSDGKYTAVFLCCSFFFFLLFFLYHTAF